MNRCSTLLFTVLSFASWHAVYAQDSIGDFPKSVEAGHGFSVRLAGSGPATLYIIGPGQVLKREVQLGDNTYFAPGSLYNAGHYLSIVVGATTNTTDEFDIEPTSSPADLSFLARPSRLPVGLHDGITGAVYLFDRYQNLVTAQTPVQFALTGPSGSVQTHQTTARDGAASVAMDSSAQQGTDKFMAQADGVSSVRIIRQVPGEPCGLKMSASPSGDNLHLVTEPVRDCNGNAVPDGTIVTFTESFHDGESTVDVPLKRGIAEVQIPSHPGATISVASGVVLGNQIRWER
jgi:hypothetical protein